MLETLAPIVVALTAAALVIAGTRTPDNRRSHSNRTASLRRVRRALREKPESRRFVAALESPLRLPRRRPKRPNIPATLATPERTSSA